TRPAPNSPPSSCGNAAGTPRPSRCTAAASSPSAATATAEPSPRPSPTTTSTACAAAWRTPGSTGCSSPWRTSPPSAADEPSVPSAGGRIGARMPLRGLAGHLVAVAVPQLLVEDLHLDGPVVPGVVEQPPETGEVDAAVPQLAPAGEDARRQRRDPVGELEA